MARKSKAELAEIFQNANLHFPEVVKLGMCSELDDEDITDVVLERLPKKFKDISPEFLRIVQKGLIEKYAQLAGETPAEMNKIMNRGAEFFRVPN